VVGEGWAFVRVEKDDVVYTGLACLPLYMVSEDFNFRKFSPGLISNDKRSVCGIFSESIHPHFEFFRLKTPIHLMFVPHQPSIGSPCQTDSIPSSTFNDHTQ